MSIRIFIWMIYFLLSKSFFHNKKIGSINSNSNNFLNIMKKEKKMIYHSNFILSSKKNNNIHSNQSNQKKQTTATPQNIKKEYIPRGINQELYFKYLNDKNTDIVLGVGPAGSGKTMFACYVAIQNLIKGNIQKIIMSRPLVSVDKEDIGYLPGNLVSKMDPWTRPMFDILLEFFSQKEINEMIHTGIIEISPLAYMRGRTFKNAFIIADEMQNSSPNQMLMMTTRIGEGTKMVITGDIKQSDREDENGLLDFINKIKKYNNNDEIENKIKLVELEAKDIERSQVVKKILKMYDPEIISNKTIPVSLELIPTLPIPTSSSEFIASVESTTQPRFQINKTNHIMNDCAMIPKNQYKI